MPGAEMGLHARDHPQGLMCHPTHSTKSKHRPQVRVSRGISLPSFLRCLAKVCLHHIFKGVYFTAAVLREEWCWCS